MTLRIGNGAGFLGDNVDAPRRLVEGALEEGKPLDYLTLEYLAELTLTILARVRRKNPRLGFAFDFLGVVDSLVASLRLQAKLKIVTNAGGMNPLACVEQTAGKLCAADFHEIKLALVDGDDLLPRLAQLQQQGCEFVNLDTLQPLRSLGKPIVSANAYVGSDPIAHALSQGARIVVTGRVADACLTVGPAAYEFGWRFDELWDRLAGASVAGHLIECGAQATGGLYRDWRNLDLAHVGYPIAEIEPDGTAVITKPAGTGGCVSVRTISEQLVYEIGDPACYLTPDVNVDFTTVRLAKAGPDRVLVRGAKGRCRPDQLKVSMAYEDGYFAAGQMLVYGRDCVNKANACAAMVLDRVRAAGFDLDRTNVECLGADQSVPGIASDPRDAPLNFNAREVVLRIAVHDARREAVERFAKEFAPLITSGPPGLAGYASGRPDVRPVFAYWPTLVPRDLVVPRVEVRTAAEWLP